MYFADVLKRSMQFANEPMLADKFFPIYDEQDARHQIKYLTRNLYRSWDKKSQREIEGIYVQIYQSPDYGEKMGDSFSPGAIHVDFLRKNFTNHSDDEHCHVLRIRHVDISDEEIEQIFDYCRRYIYNLNPENYRHKITRKFTLEDVRELAKANGLTEDLNRTFFKETHLFYLPGNSECHWTMKFDETENCITFPATRYKVDPKRYYLHSSQHRDVYDLCEAKLLLPRIIEDYYDKYPKYLKMDLERTLNKLD